MDPEEKRKISIERGKRVKLARQLANLTRKDMLMLYNINPNTIQAWEKGANCLSEKNAINLANFFNQSGISLTVEWLLYGSDPMIVNDLTTENIDPELRNILNIRGDLKIFEEINYFRKNNHEGITTMVTDDALFPLFNIGDYVGGISVFGEAITTLVGEFCIITSTENKIIIRKILKYENQLFTVSAINPIANLDTPPYDTCSIISAAKISRHWLIGEKPSK